MLLLSLKKSGNAATVSLAGGIDESAESVLTPYLPKLAKLDVTFDLARIEQVNSIGFRQWLKFLRALSAEATFSFANCPPSFLDYAALLAQTAYANQIVSVLVPYGCSECKKSETVAFDVDAWEEGEDFEERICGKCNGLMQAEVSASEMLSFLRAGNGT